MKSTKQLSKRGFSPIATKNAQTSDRKKKSTSAFQQISYKPRQFPAYTKTDKKRSSNYLKEMLHKPQSANKYRIVTQPVDDRVMTIVSSSFVPSKSRGKGQLEHSTHKIRQTSVPKAQSTCMHCQRYLDELNYLKNELSRIVTEKSLWKMGQMNLDDVKSAWNLGSIIVDVKKHFHDLMRDIESLTEIDYPKMLGLKIFKYGSSEQSVKTHEQIEIKNLLGQLRNHYQGKITAWDLEDESQESDHVKAIMRNLKARLSHYLRQNLELKAKKAILQKAQQMSCESEQYLRLIIEDVLRTYGSKL